MLISQVFQAQEGWPGLTQSGLRLNTISTRRQKTGNGGNFSLAVRYQ